MKIQSKFKDYYDHIGRLYGEDPGVVYVRGKVPGFGDLKYGRGDNPFPRFTKESVKDKITCDVEYIIAGEMFFSVVRSLARWTDSHTQNTVYQETYELFNRLYFDWFNGNHYAYTNPVRKSLTLINERDWHRFQDTLADTSFKKKIRALTVKAGVPVFKVSYLIDGSLRIEEHTPILASHCIPSVIGPGGMWQNIYSTMTGVLRKDPDKEVPVKLSNESRIHKAGFDLKSSFRHPVNKKKNK